MSDTIVALSSGRLPAAIAVIRVSGPQASEAAKRLVGTLPVPRRASLRDFRDPKTDELIDQGLLLYFPGPDSATGEDLVEFHCHGSRAVVEALIHALSSDALVRPAEPGEFTRQALQNGRFDLTEAEGLADLLEAETQGQRRAALKLVGGGLHEQLDSLREQLIDCSAMAEAVIDYVGDDEETSGQESALANAIASARASVENLLSLPDRRPLRDGIRVVLAGPPNAGKSSLFNALVGFDRAIVSDQAGTTRDVIDIPFQIDGIAYVLTDTAGLRDGKEEIERAGIDRASVMIEEADILLWLGLPKDAPEHPHLVRIASKKDIVPASQPYDVSLSAKTGEGLTDLLARMHEIARDLLPAENGLSLTQRHRDSLQGIRDLLIEANGDDGLLVAESLRTARSDIDKLVGAQGMDEVIDRIFSRFCLGK